LKATEDRRSAELILSADPPLLDPAAYHCQQAGEKLLKGLLVAAGQSTPKSHDLWQFTRLVSQAVPSLEIDLDTLADLTPWATVTRYPDLDTELGITAQDILDALSNIDRLVEAIGQLRENPTQ